jgi:hypothetical protein
VLGSSPAHSHPLKGSSDGLPAKPLLGESLLETHLGGHRKRPQAALLAELSGTALKHLAQSLGPFSIEGPMNGVRAVRASSERLGKTLFVALVDGVAHRLRVTAEVAGYLVGVLPTGAGEQDLATTQSEGLEGERKPASRALRSASLKGRTKIGRFME